MPPWKLPEHKTQSGIKTKSSKGGAVGAGEKNGAGDANAIRFGGKAGQEQLWLHAQKDQLTEVEHDEDKWVGNDRRKTVDRNETSTIHRGRTEVVDRNEKINVPRRTRPSRDGSVRRGAVWRRPGVSRVRRGPTRWAAPCRPARNSRASA
jgi:uncharacterized protein involved in type VI secretion and phage assembly